MTIQNIGHVIPLDWQSQRTQKRIGCTQFRLTTRAPWLKYQHIRIYQMPIIRILWQQISEKYAFCPRPVNKSFFQSDTQCDPVYLVMQIHGSRRGTRKFITNPLVCNVISKSTNCYIKLLNRGAELLEQDQCLNTH